MTAIVGEDVAKVVSIHAEQLRGALGRSFLVTGAGGMVGGYVVHALMELGRRASHDKPMVVAEVRDVGRAEPWLGQYIGQDNFRFCECAVEDIGRQNLPAVDYVVHAACPASPSAFREHSLSVIGANILGTMSVLELARRNDARMCLISSMEVYGSRRMLPTTQALSEEDFTSDDPLDVRSAYPESKRMAENLSACHRAEYGTDFVITRLGHSYGPGMKLTDTRVQTQFMRSALSGQGITIRSDGRKTRAYTYIADACSAILLAILNGASGGAYNIANNDAVVSIRQLAEIILAQVGPASGPLTFDGADVGLNMWSRMNAPVMLDISRITTLGWRPQTGISEGIERTLRHHRVAGLDRTSGAL